MKALGTRKRLRLKKRLRLRRKYFEHGLQNTPEAKEALGRFAVELRECRIESQKTLHQLSEEAGCSLSQLANIERGANWPSMVLYISLCRALGQPKPPFVT